MKETRFSRCLRKELPLWVERGWVSPEAEQQILNHVTSQDAGGIRYMPLAFSILGVLLLGSGIITFFAAHWTELSKLTKLTILIGGMWTAYGLSAYFLEYRNSPPLGQAMLLLGVILFGADIMLIAQIYHIDAHFPNGVLLWSLGGLLAAYLVNAQPAMIAGIALAVLWTGLENREFGHSAHWPFLVVWCLFLPPIHKHDWKGASHLALMALLLWSLFSFPALERSGYGVERIPAASLSQIYFLSYLALYILGASLATDLNASGLFRRIRDYSALAALTCFYILTFPDVHNAGRYFPGVTPAFHAASAGSVITTLIAITAVILLAVWHWKRTAGRESRLDLRWGQGLVSLIVALEIVNLFADRRYGGTVAILFNLLFFAGVIWLIYAGFHRGDRFTVNLGFAFFALGLLGRYFDTFWTLLNRSFFFMVGGLILIVGGYFLEKQRRKLTGSISSIQSPVGGT